MTQIVDLQGERELIRTLSALPGSVQASILRGMERKLLRPVVRAAKTTLRGLRASGELVDSTGQLCESIGVKIVKRPKRGRIVGLVGARSKKGARGRNPAKYAHLVELGTAPHSIGAIEHPGAKAKPFLKPAWDTQEGQMIPQIAQLIKDGIDKAIQKHAKNK